MSSVTLATIVSGCSSDWLSLRRGRDAAAPAVDALDDANTSDIQPGDTTTPPSDSGDAEPLDGISPTGKQLVTGDHFTCTYSAGTATARCIGDNANGQFGLGSFDLRNAPTPLTGLPTSATIVQLSAGSSSLCALVERGGARSVHCAGSRGDSQLGDGSTGAASLSTFTAVRGLPDGPIIEIASGATAHCAIAGADRALYCWGRLDYRLPRWATATRVASQSGEISGFDRAWIGRNSLFARQTSGALYVIGVRDTGMLLSAGAGALVSTLAPLTLAPGAPTSIAANTGYACAVMDRRVFCWGSGSGAWGNDLLTPTEVALGTNVRATTVVVGERHGCALSDDANVYCWGVNASGELGSSTALPSGSTTPNRVTLPQRATALASGFSHVCALLENGSVACWGSGAHGQLAHVVTVPPTDQGRTVRQIAVNSDITCTADGGRLQCFGENDRWAPMEYRAVGDTTVLQTAATIQSIAISNQLYSVYGICATTSTNAVFCAGSPLSAFTTMATPIAVPQGVNDGDAGRRALSVRNISLGSNFALAVDATSSEVYGWGSGGSGNFGSAGLTSIPYAISLRDSAMTAEALDPLEAGGDFVCGRRTTSGELLCWGSDSNGQAAAGSLTYRPFLPTVVGGLRVAMGARTFSVGGAHICAIGRRPGDSQDFTYCWGANQSFQAGLVGTHISRVTRDGLPSDLAAIAAGGQHTCAITTGGVVRCWGDNRFGQLGTTAGGVVAPNEPVNVTLPAGETPVWIDAGSRHTCVVSARNRALCWGWRGLGQIQRGSEPLPFSRTAQLVTAL